MRVIATADGTGAPLRYWKTLWFRWCGAHYRRLSVEDVRDELYDMLADAVYTDARGNPQPWKPTETKLNQVIDSHARSDEGSGAGSTAVLDRRQAERPRHI